MRKMKPKTIKDRLPPVVFDYYAKTPSIIEWVGVTESDLTMSIRLSSGQIHAWKRNAEGNWRRDFQKDSYARNP